MAKRVNLESTYYICRAHARKIELQAEWKPSLILRLRRNYQILMIKRSGPILTGRRRIETGEDSHHGVMVKACGLHDSEIRYRCRNAKVRHEDGSVFIVLAVSTTITV